jgi:hypothetical protein
VARRDQVMLWLVVAFDATFSNVLGSRVLAR